MTSAAFMDDLLGWGGSGGDIPNIADSDNRTSVRIAGHMLSALGITATTSRTGGQSGTGLEHGIRDHLAAALPVLDGSRMWDVSCKTRVSEFVQYAHLLSLQQMINSDRSGILSTEIGSDYLIKPDVTVAIPSPPGPFLHAAVSCKWTIRSDRVQNIRHEGVILTRHRRGRQPHIVTVTPEPLPTRLASIARGTGEIDALYHVLFNELIAATDAYGTDSQKGVLEELVTQGRVLPLDELAPTLVL